MPSKTEEYLALAQRTANGLTRYWESWTDYLTTASRLYKYPFADQLMIYAQRPDATACADYDIWNNRMNRYVRRGSKGIALLDESSGFQRLHYVFDVSDTGVRRNSRDPDLWQYNDDLKQPVSEMLAATYGISGERVSQQLADVAGKLVADYWDNNSEDISAIVDGSLLMDYDEAGVEMQFKSAAAISVTYTLLERCGFEPDGYFDKDSFQAIYDFSTPDTVYTLGAAVSDISREVLRTVERAVKTTIRRRNNERSQHKYEQQSELYADRGLSSPEPDPASAEEPAGHVRQDAPELSDTAATIFEEFQGNILKYSNDGALYTDTYNERIWNQTYEMKEPMADVCEDYVALADKGGTEIYIMNQAGMQGKIETPMNISRISVANQCVVAVWMESDGENYIRMYD